MKPSIQAIVLAAGFASRHPDKLVHPIDGKPAIVHGVQRLLDAGLEPIIVLGHQADRLESLLRSHFAEQVRVVVNEDYSRGLATSIRAGLMACDPQTEAYLIHLADKPFVRAATIQDLIKTWMNDQPEILVPEYKGMHGHPVIFRNTMRDALLNLTGDSGASRLLREMDSDVRRWKTEDAGVTLDLDAYLEQTDD